MSEAEMARRVAELREYVDRRFSEHDTHMQLTDRDLTDTRLTISGLVTRADLKAAFSEFEANQAKLQLQREQSAAATANTAARHQDRIRPYTSGVFVQVCVGVIFWLAVAGLWAASHGLHIQQLGGTP